MHYICISEEHRFSSTVSLDSKCFACYENYWMTLYISFALLRVHASGCIWHLCNMWVNDCVGCRSLNAAVLGLLWFNLDFFDIDTSSDNKQILLMMKTCMQFLCLAKLCNNMLLSVSFCIVSIENLKLMHIYFSTPTPFKVILTYQRPSVHLRADQQCKPCEKKLPLCTSCISLQLWVSMHLSARCCDLELHTCASTTWKWITSAPRRPLFQTLRNWLAPVTAVWDSQISGVFWGFQHSCPFYKVNIKHSLQHIAMHCCMHLCNANVIEF